jgi:hypothetical protein
MVDNPLSMQTYFRFVNYFTPPRKARTNKAIFIYRQICFTQSFVLLSRYYFAKKLLTYIHNIALKLLA